MKRILQLFILAHLSMIFWSCDQNENYIDYTDKNLPAPKQVYDVRVIPKNGGADIVYKIPKDPNLSYVKAVYETSVGKTWEVKSSYYTDTLKVEGFGDTNDYEVKLYSVGKNERESEPLIVAVKPLIPAIQSVYGTLAIAATFGGINIKLQNPERADLAVVVMVDSLDNGHFEELTTYYTAADKISFSLRGMNTKAKNFSVKLRDRWNNQTEQQLTTLTPLFEKELDKSKWRAVELPGDNFQYVENYPLRKIFDGGFGYCCLFATDRFLLPHTITLDLGSPVVLSRMKTWLHPEGAYQSSHPKDFEVWGATTINPDGDYIDVTSKTYRDNWVKLASFSSFKPSGPGEITPEDRDYALNRGEDFEYEPGIPEVRYIRIKTLNTWGIPSGSTQVVIQELSIWGQDANN